MVLAERDAALLAAVVDFQGRRDRPVGGEFNHRDQRRAFVGVGLDRRRFGEFGHENVLHAGRAARQIAV